MARSRPHLPRITRDALFVVAGLCIAAFEVISGDNNPAAFGFALIVMGLPIPAQIGEKLWRASTNQRPEGYYRRRQGDDEDEWERRWDQQRERIFERLDPQRRPPRHRPPAP